MKKSFIHLFLLLLFFYALIATAQPQPLLEQSHQLLLVTTTNWHTLKGTLQRYQRVNHQWQPIGHSIPVVIGKNGMGWGTAFNFDGPIKVEGDNKSPAGIFAIGSAFGFASKNKTKLDYLPITSTTFCVDDQKSKYYNQVIPDTSKIPDKDWTSGEQMQQVDVYKKGIIVQFNINNKEIGRGSCIFMHIWRNENNGTAGCIAMEETNLSQLLNWLDPVKKPVIVLLPKGEYKKLQSEWVLP
jgi:D-alanyl-D-alanine dipeptidase